MHGEPGMITCLPLNPPDPDHASAFFSPSPPPSLHHQPRITAMIEKAEAAPATTSLDDFDHDEDDATSSSAGGTTHDAAANGAGLGDSKISSPAAAFDIDSTKGGMQGPVRQLQMDLMAERQRREAAEAMLRRVRTGLLQAKHVWDQERACRLEAEQKLQVRKKKKTRVETLLSLAPFHPPPHPCSPLLRFPFSLPFAFFPHSLNSHRRLWRSCAP